MDCNAHSVWEFKGSFLLSNSIWVPPRYWPLLSVLVSLLLLVGACLFIRPYGCLSFQALWNISFEDSNAWALAEGRLYWLQNFPYLSEIKGFSRLWIPHTARSHGQWITSGRRLFMRAVNGASGRLPASAVWMWLFFVWRKLLINIFTRHSKNVYFISFSSIRGFVITTAQNDKHRQILHVVHINFLHTVQVSRLTKWTKSTVNMNI